VPLKLHPVHSPIAVRFPGQSESAVRIAATALE